MIRYSFLLIFLLWFPGVVPGADDNLTPECREKLAEHNAFLEFARAHGGVFRKDINTDRMKLFSVTMAKAPGAVEGKLTVPLPPEFVRFWPFYRELCLIGDDESVYNVNAYLVSSDGEKQMIEKWWDGASRKYFVCRKLKPDSKSGKEYGILLEGNAKLREICFTWAPGWETDFDFLPYSKIGADKPVENRILAISFMDYRGIEDNTAFNWRDYYRFYERPRIDFKTHDELRKRNFVFGREQTKFFWSDKPSFVKEDPERPGWASEKWFEDEMANVNSDEKRKFLELFPPDFKYAMCFDNWPQFMHVKNPPPGEVNLRGTPDVALFDAAAELAAKWVQIEIAKQGRTATWWEVKNEPNISPEWMYHVLPCGLDASWDLLAKFHNKVADAIHKASPETKVGGLASSTISLENENFGYAARIFKFMDATRDHLDFYSFHYYGGADMSRPQKKDYFYGAFDAINDMLRTHMRLARCEKPIVVSECGGEGGSMDEVECFKSIYRSNGILMRFLNNTDLFCFTCQMTRPVTVFEKNSVDRPNKMIHFFDLWGGHTGKYLLPVSTDADGITCHAVIDGVNASVMINNVRPRRYSLDMKAVLPEGVVVTGIEQVRLYLENGKITYSVEKPDPRRIPVAGCETTLIKLSLSKAPEIRTMLDERLFCGDRMLLRDTGKKEIEVACPPSGIESSFLRIGAGYASGTMAVSFNAKEVGKMELEGIGSGMSTYDFAIDPSLIREKNKVEISLSKPGTITTAVLCNTYRRPCEAAGVEGNK